MDAELGGHFSIRDLAAVALPTGQREGLFVMLRAYFDDSGTHSNSRVVVLGGLIGTVAQWDSFEAQWSAKLKSPLPGKKPLMMFHLSHCNAHDGEFKDYNNAEQDWVTREFRQIIIDANFISFAAGIDRKAWRELVTSDDKNDYGTDLKQCVQKCVEETVQVAGLHPFGDNISIVFDRGIWTKDLKDATDPYTYHMGRPRIVSITAMSVVDSFPLQGADVVATENYWHFAKALELGEDALPRPHLRHYLENMIHQGVILDRKEIEALLRAVPSSDELSS